MFELIFVLSDTGGILAPLSLLGLYHFIKKTIPTIYKASENDNLKQYINIFLWFEQVIHAAVGLVRSNPVLTAFQIASRVFLIWGICYLVPEVR